MGKTIRRRLLLLALLALLIVGAVYARSAIRMAERVAYPRAYAEYVEYYAAKFGVDANQVYAIIRTESGFAPNARSDVGARGLMQITQETFTWIKGKIAPTEDVSFDDLYDPELNIRFGTYLLSVCMKRYQGDLPTAAAAYHSGLGLVDGLVKDERYSSNGKTLHTFPYAQMRNYVGKVRQNFKKYTSLYAKQ